MPASMQHTEGITHLGTNGVRVHRKRGRRECRSALQHAAVCVEQKARSGWQGQETKARGDDAVCEAAAPRASTPAGKRATGNTRIADASTPHASRPPAPEHSERGRWQHSATSDAACNASHPVNLSHHASEQASPRSAQDKVERCTGWRCPLRMRRSRGHWASNAKRHSSLHCASRKWSLCFRACGPPTS